MKYYLDFVYGRCASAKRARFHFVETYGISAFDNLGRNLYAFEFFRREFFSAAKAGNNARLIMLNNGKTEFLRIECENE